VKNVGLLVTYIAAKTVFKSVLKHVLPVFSIMTDCVAIVNTVIDVVKVAKKRNRIA
jgi:hypothetical protein